MHSMALDGASYHTLGDDDHAVESRAGYQDHVKSSLEDNAKRSLERLSIEESGGQPAEWSEYVAQRGLYWPGSKSRRHWPRLIIVLAPLFILAALLLGGLARLFTRSFEASDIGPQANGRKYAFATLLSLRPDAMDKEKHILDDPYFTATRLLGYQLLHDPLTKNQLGAPLIVIASHRISKAKVDRLKKDGLTVFQVPESEFINPKLYQSGNSYLFQGVWNKLFVWKFTEYDRILYLDSDHILTRRIDSIFDEPQVKLCHNRRIENATLADEGPQPDEYLYAPNPELAWDHPSPATKEDIEKGRYGDYPNAGFFVTKPDLKMFDYMMSVTRTPDKFDPINPEQNLFEYTFRPNGSMPWSMLEPKWSIHRPRMEDTTDGVYALHEKYWNDEISRDLSDWMKAWRWKMEGFYTAKDGNM